MLDGLASSRNASRIVIRWTMVPDALGFLSYRNSNLVYKTLCNVSTLVRVMLSLLLLNIMFLEKAVLSVSKCQSIWDLLSYWLTRMSEFMLGFLAVPNNCIINYTLDIFGV